MIEIWKLGQLNEQDRKELRKLTLRGKGSTLKDILDDWEFHKEAIAFLCYGTPPEEVIGWLLAIPHKGSYHLQTYVKYKHRRKGIATKLISTAQQKIKAILTASPHSRQGEKLFIKNNVKLDYSIYDCR